MSTIMGFGAGGLLGVPYPGGVGVGFKAISECFDRPVFVDRDSLVLASSFERFLTYDGQGVGVSFLAFFRPMAFLPLPLWDLTLLLYSPLIQFMMAAEGMDDPMNSSYSLWSMAHLLCIYDSLQALLSTIPPLVYSLSISISHYN